MQITRMVIALIFALPAGAQNAPSWQQYQSAFATAMEDARNQSAWLPQPPIDMAGQFLNGNLHSLGIAAGGRGNWSGPPFTGGWLSGSCNPGAGYNLTGSCVWNNAGAGNAFIDGAYRAGVRVLDVNLDPVVLAAASDYNPQGLATANYLSSGGGCTGTSGNVSFPNNGGVVGSIAISGGQPSGGIALTHPGYGFSGTQATGTVAGCPGQVTFSITLDTSKVVWSDCPGGTPGVSPGPTFAFGATPPNNTGQGGKNWACATLYNYDQWFQYAVTTKGMKLHLRIKPDSVNTVVNWHQASGPIPATTENEFVDQYAPFAVAAAARWGNLAPLAPGAVDLTLLHEAVGGFGSNVSAPFTQQWIQDYITYATATIRNILNNTTIKLGACGDTVFPGDLAYMNMYLTHPALNYVCIDLYLPGCTMATYGTTVLSKAYGFAQTAKANGKAIRLEESSAPPHLPFTGNGSSTDPSCPGPGDNLAYEESGWVNYMTSGVHNSWLESITPLMSAWGMIGTTVFCDEWMMNTTTDISNANCTGWTNVQGIGTYTIASGGTGYHVGQSFTVVQPPNGWDSRFMITAIGAGGSITGTTQTAPGMSYSVASGLATAIVDGSTGTGATVNITSIVSNQPWYNLTTAELAASPVFPGVTYSVEGAWPAGGPASLQGNARLGGRTAGNVGRAFIKAGR